MGKEDKQIKELEYDIADTVDSIVNDMLGISSIGDAMEPTHSTTRKRS